MLKFQLIPRLGCLLLPYAIGAFSQGLEPGNHIPAFRLPDQNGTFQTFEQIRGPRGAMLVFYRSADW
jgi:hypothetical protein